MSADDGDASGTDSVLDGITLDPDVAAMTLSVPEKLALQINRDFNAKVQRHREKVFREEIDKDEFPEDSLARFLKLLEIEDARALPVIFCSYIDEVFREMYKREIPDHVPGGKKALFGAYGPFSDFSGLIKLAYCFQLISADLLVDIDRVRRIRNSIAHTWAVDELESYFSTSAFKEMAKAEKMLGEVSNLKMREHLAERFYEQLSELDKFRIRLIWLASRTTYEARHYFRAHKHGIDPHRTLFLDGGTKWMGKMARMAFHATARVVGRTITE